MFFSILLPVYNTIEYLPECMDSILSQTFTDFEVVLLDDGSKDDSGKLCDEYAAKDSRIRVIHKQNEGLMMTRRRGFQEAKGKYCICVDSDDKLYDDHALEKIHSLIAKSDCDLVICNYVYGAGRKEEEWVREIFDYPDGHIFDEESKYQVYEKLVTTNYMNNIWIKCPSRDIVDIDTDYSVWKKEICRAEDLFQSFPMLDRAKRIGYVNAPLYYYRWTDNSISAKVNFNYYYAFKCIFSREDHYLEKWKLPDDITEKAYRRRIERVAEIICTSYFRCKSSKRLPEWKEHILTLSEDDFFISILDKCDRKKVIKYYRILHSCIVNKRVNLAVAAIEIFSGLSKLRHKIK